MLARVPKAGVLGSSGETWPTHLGYLATPSASSAPLYTFICYNIASLNYGATHLFCYILYIFPILVQTSYKNVDLFFFLSIGCRCDVVLYPHGIYLTQGLRVCLVRAKVRRGVIKSGIYHNQPHYNTFTSIFHSSISLRTSNEIF